MEPLRVPRDRVGYYSPRILTRYQRRQKTVNRLVREMFLQGVSTRKMQGLLNPLPDNPFSSRSVSRITRSLDWAVKRYYRRPLADQYPHLLLDGITLKVKLAAGVKKRLVLCVYGTIAQGRREPLNFHQDRAKSPSPVGELPPRLEPGRA